MTPKIKFALKFGDNAIRTIEALKQHFTAKDLLAHYESGRLRAWLEVYGFEEERKRLDALVKTETQADKIKALAKVFGIPERSTILLNGLQEMEAEKKRQEERQESSSSPKGPADWREWFKSASEVKRKQFLKKHSFADEENALRTVNHLFAPQEDDFDHIKATIDLLARMDVFKSDDRTFTYFLQALQATKNALVAAALWLNQTLRKRCRAKQKFFTQWVEKGDFLVCLGNHKHDVLLSEEDSGDGSLSSFFSSLETLVNHGNFLAIALYVENCNAGNFNDSVSLVFDFGILGKGYYLIEGREWLWRTGNRLAYHRNKSFTHGDPKYRLIYVEF